MSDTPQIDDFIPLTILPLVIIVTRVPTIFQKMPHFTEMLHALIERHAKRVEGVEFGYTLEYEIDETAPDGQINVTPKNARRTSVNPTFTFQEVKGNIIWNFFSTWIRKIKDPDIQISDEEVTQLLNVKLSDIEPVSPLFYSMDIMCIQFDETYVAENIIDAFYIKNMWPLETGPSGWKRVIGEITYPERIIPFTGTVEHDVKTKEDGINFAKTMELHEIKYESPLPTLDF